MKTTVMHVGVGWWFIALFAVANVGWAEQPVASVMVSSIDELHDDLSQLLKQADRTGELEQLELAFRSLPAGIDRTRKVGAVLAGEKEAPAVMVFLPITKLADLLADPTVRLMVGEVERLENGLLKVAGPQPTFAKEKNGWLYISPKRELVAGELPDDPAKLTPAPGVPGDIALQVDLTQIPDPVRNTLRNIGKSPDEIAGVLVSDQIWIPQDIFGAIIARQVGNAMTVAFDELEQFSLGITLDGKNADAQLDLAVRFLEGGQAAPRVKKLAAASSELTGLLKADAAVNLHYAIPLTAEDSSDLLSWIKGAKPGLPTFSPPVEEGNATQEDPFTEMVLRLLQSTLGGEKHSGGAAMFVEPENSTIVIGGIARDADELRPALIEFVVAAQRAAGSDADEFIRNKHKGFTLITVGDIPGQGSGIGPVELFPKKSELVAAQNGTRFYVAMGVDCKTKIKSLIDGAAAGEQPCSPFGLQIRVAPLLEVSYSKDEPADEFLTSEYIEKLLAMKEADRVRLGLSSTDPRSASLRLEVEKLPLLMAIATAAAMGSGESLAPVEESFGNEPATPGGPVVPFAAIKIKPLPAIAADQLPNSIVRKNTIKIESEEGTTCFALSPDGKRFAVAVDYELNEETFVESDTIQIGDVATGKIIRSIEVSHGLWSLTFSPDGQKLAAGMNHGAIAVWDCESGEQEMQLVGDSVAITALCYAPDGSWLASGAESFKRRVELWGRGGVKHSISLESRDIEQVAFSPNGKQLLAVGGNGVAYVWDVASAKLIAELKNDDRGYRWASFSPDGTSVAAAEHDYGNDKIEVWSLETKKIVASIPTDSRNNLAVFYLPDGKSLFTACNENRGAILKIWDVASKSVRVQVAADISGLEDAAISRDGTTAAVLAGSDLSIWKLSHSSEEAIPEPDFDVAGAFSFGNLWLMQDQFFTPRGNIHPAIMKAAAGESIDKVAIRSDLITDSGVAKLLAAPWFAKVDTLTLKGESFTDESLKQIGKATWLYELNLISNQRITSTGIAHLKPLKHVRSLNLSSTNLDDAAAALLAANHPKLRSLNISRTKITDEGLKAIGKLTNLDSLQLTRNAISDEGLSSLQNLARLTSLDLDDASYESEIKVKIRGPGLIHLRKLTHLESLSLESTPLTDAGLVHLAKLPKLSRLDLTNTKITDKGLASLGDCERLSSLYLDRTGVTDIGLAHLAAVKTLVSISVDGSEVTYEGVEALKQKLPDLGADGVPKPTILEHLVKVEPVSTIEFGGQHDELMRMAYSPDNKLMVLAGQKKYTVGQVLVHKVDAAKPLYSLDLGQAVDALAISADSKRLLIGGWKDDKASAWIWNLETKKYDGRISQMGTINCLGFLGDGTRFFVGSTEGYYPDEKSLVTVRDSATGKVLTKWEGATSPVAAAPDGKSLVCMGTGLQWFDIETGKETTQLPLDLANPQDNLRLEYATISSVDFSADGLLCGSAIELAGESLVAVAHVKTKEFVTPLKQYGSIRSFSISPDGKRVVTLCGVKEKNRGIATRACLRLYDVAAGKEIGSMYFDDRLGEIKQTFFSPDGKQVIVRGKEAKVWNLAEILEAAGK